MRDFAVALLLFVLSSVFFSPAAQAASEAQRAYDACTKHHNETYRFKENYKAIVSGVANNRTKCFWSWGYKSVGDAIRAATANCEKEFNKCYLYATSSGNSDWVARISNMGGNDGTKYSGGGGSGGGAAMGQFVEGFIGGVLNGIGGGGISGGGSNGGTVCTPEQRARGWSEERCARN